MDTSYLAQQVNSIVGQLHALFDEIGVPSHERESRESELFSALSETLNKQVRTVTNEKKSMIEDAQKAITAIRQMETSLDDSASRRSYQEDDELKITYPLTRCLQVLKEKQIQIGRLHKERFEQVKKLVEALESYSSHLEPTFVRVQLPPTGPNQSIPPSFDLSPAYVDKLDKEFTRVYEEYSRRVATVQALGDHIIQLWAELGTPQAQTDSSIVKYYRDAPEQLGLHEEDIGRLRTRRDKLSDEKKHRERTLRDLKSAVDALWQKLGIEESEQKSFLNANRGCGVRQINEFEDELHRLNELKRQNLHLFVEDARCRLQELWDALYFSEDEMLEFTPAFSDVYSDALLEAHERELARLEALREQRAPILALVERHRSLVQERDDLTASSQDASRLMMRGAKGERRDPGKLLREEKMRKRIAKELPKVAADVRKALEKWEDEWGVPFLVHGERYIDAMEPEGSNKASGPRSKTPAGPPPSTNKNAKSAPPSRANSTTRPAAPSRIMTRTPTSNAPAKRQPPPAQTGTAANPKGSPSRIPSRQPLGNLKHGGNSPERHRPESRSETAPTRPGPPLMRAPPPKMRDLKSVPELETPVNPYASAGLSNIIRNQEPEDVYDDHAREHRHVRAQSNHVLPRPASRDEYYQMQHKQAHLVASYPAAPPPRQISNTSHTSHTSTVSGSENWETYDDNSEPEPDASDTYYAKVRAARGKRVEPDQGHRSQAGPATKRYRGLPQAGSHMVTLDEAGNRIISGSEWTDEDAF